LTEEELRVTDIADHALETLIGSNVEEIVVLGRRGPEQAAFTNPELRELAVMGDADVIVDPSDLRIADDLREDQLGQTAQRNIEILSEYAQRAPQGRSKRIVLRFFSSPVELLGDEVVERLRVVRNTLVRDDDGRLRARATDHDELIDCSLVFRAIGYLGVPIPGLPFDERRGVIRNQDGRVVGVPATYVAGWIKRGPSGVIGTNKRCASDTVASLLADLESGELGGGQTLDPGEIDRRLRERQPDLVDYLAWGRIDTAEKAAGERQGRPRVKFTRAAELLEASGVRAVARDPAG
jgi:ferredoxin--NADP+ reductase